MPGAVVGEIFKKRAIRAPVNPMDKATIVSIYPREIDEKKATLTPNRWVIPPGKVGKPSICIVGPSSWWREIDEDQPLLEIPVSSILIAESVCRDWMNGIVGCDMAESIPGIFFVPGELTAKEVTDKYSKALELAKRRQENWYEALIKLADSLWARSNGNPLAISDDMRLAARELGIEATKDWMNTVKSVGMVRCKACGSLRNPDYPVCQTCRAIDDPETAKKLGIVFATF